MRKIFLPLSVIAVATATIASGSAIAKHGPPHGNQARQNNNNGKVWICHLANSRQYVAIRVSGSARDAHLRHGADIVITPQPETRAAARAICRTTPLLTPTRGGARREATLTGPGGVTVQLQVRVRLGQGQLCFRLTGLSATATDIGSLTITRDGTTVATTTFAGTQTTASGCVAISRAVARDILREPGDFTVSAVVTVGGANVTLTGTLSR